MSRYIYEGLDLTGKKVAGELDASSDEALTRKLQEDGLFPVKIKLSTHLHSRTRGWWNIINPHRRKILTTFTRQLSDLLKSKFPLVEAITIILEHTEAVEFQSALRMIIYELQAGVKFSDALSKFPSLFSPIYIALIKAGESSGVLDIILDNIANSLEKQNVLINNFLSSILYPLLITIVGSVTVIFVMTVIIPKMLVIFQTIEGNLPVPTVVLINISNFLCRFWWAIIGGICLVLLVIRQYLQTEGGRMMLNRIMLSLPIIGALNKKVIIHRFASTGGLLLANGVGVSETLRIIADTTGNIIIRDKIEASYRTVQEGKGIVHALINDNIFPHFVLRMIAVGERSGNLAHMLTQIAQIYNDEIDSTLKGLVSLIEPLLILTVGLMIGFIVMATLLPVFTMGISG